MREGWCRSCNSNVFQPGRIRFRGQASIPIKIRLAQKSSRDVPRRDLALVDGRQSLVAARYRSDRSFDTSGKVLGLGTTDALAGFAAVTANLVVSFYFAKRGFENVARIIRR